MTHFPQISVSPAAVGRVPLARAALRPVKPVSPSKWRWDADRVVALACLIALVVAIALI